MEHCPPRTLYDRNKSKTPVKVPSCPDHNENNSLDDEYFRTFLLLGSGDDIVDTEPFQRQLRGIRNNPSLAKRISRTFTQVDLKLESGVILPNQPAFRAEPE